MPRRSRKRSRRRHSRRRKFGMRRLLDPGCTADGTMTGQNPLARFFDQLVGINNPQRTAQVIQAHPEFIQPMAQMMALIEQVGIMTQTPREPSPEDLAFLRQFWSAAEPLVKQNDELLRDNFIRAQRWVNDFNTPGLVSELRPRSNWAEEFNAQSVTSAKYWEDRATCRIENLTGHLAAEPAQIDSSSLSSTTLDSTSRLRPA